MLITTNVKTLSSTGLLRCVISWKLVYGELRLSPLVAGFLYASKHYSKNHNEEIMNIKKITKGVIFGFLGLFILLIIIAVNTDSSTEESSSVVINRCIDISPELTERITSGLKEGNEELTISDMKAVKSKDFSSVYFVSMKIGNDVSTISTNSLSEPGMIFSIGLSANEYFAWPDGAKTDAELSRYDDGAEESRECVENL
jgi:hypothetical protein